MSNCRGLWADRAITPRRVGDWFVNVSDTAVDYLIEESNPPIVQAAVTGSKQALICFDNYTIRGRIQFCQGFWKELDCVIGRVVPRYSGLHDPSVWFLPVTEYRTARKVACSKGPIPCPLAPLAGDARDLMLVRG